VACAAAGIFLVGEISTVSAASKKKGSSSSSSSGSRKKSSATPTPPPEQPAPPLPKRDDTAPAATPSAPNSTPAPVEPPKPRYEPSASLPPTDLLGFEEQPPRVRKLITAALELAKLNLTYTPGSDDPAKGGMDCSGAVAYLLRQQGFKDVPRDAAGQYVWARTHGQFFAVLSKKPGGFEFADIQPGDLMFWSGTYETKKDPPITHSMIFLGVQRKRGQYVMWGSSDGRSYEGKPRNGVSVFDFKMPRTEPGMVNPVDFLGYARIPGLREEEPPRVTPTAAKAKAK
jgi:cell wall-associated NlpC family hydrolase